MRRRMDKLFRRYGLEARVGEQRVRIFFQACTSKSWQNMEPTMGPLGIIPGGQFLYIGPAAVVIRAGDTVTVGDRSFILRRAEAVSDDRGPIYRWGLCVEKGGDDIWV